MVCKHRVITLLFSLYTFLVIFISGCSSDDDPCCDKSCGENAECVVVFNNNDFERSQEVSLIPVSINNVRLQNVISGDIVNVESGTITLGPLESVLYVTSN